MDFFEPDVKVVEQGVRDTQFMYLIAQGACKVTTYFYTAVGGSKMAEQTVRIL